jgi:hypothetical protein
MRGSAAFRTGVAPGGALAGPWVRNPLWRTARAVPSLDLDFAGQKSLKDGISGQDLITFTRASSGTFVGSDGLIKTAATNEPRFDHDPTTGESLGLLVEEARTNSILQSQDFSTTWTNSGSSENTNVAVAPDGTSTADALVDTAINETHNFTQTLSGLAGSTAHTFSCFLKKGSKNHGVLVFAPNISWGIGTGASVFFDLNNGTVGTAANATGTIQALPNGWYRCTATATTAVTPGTVTMRIGSSLTGSAQTYTGTGDEAIYSWGAQLEAGAFATSYIPTTTATVTRAADVASITGSNFSSWYNQAEGTVFADANSPTSGTQITFDDGTVNTNRVVLYYQSVTDPRLFVASAGATSCIISAGTITSNSRALLVGAYKLNDFAVSVNGAAPVLDASGDAPTGVDRARLGRSSADGAYLNGCLRRLTYWPTRFASPTLQAITQ